MGIGQMRDRVSIYEIGETSPDGIQGSNTAKLLVKTCWAKCEALDGYRADQGSGIKNYERWRMTIRAGSYNITTNNIIGYKDRDHTIESVLAQSNIDRYTIIETWVAQ